jgi:hypothetical protein
MTVSGWTMRRADFHSGQIRESQTQRRRSAGDKAQPLFVVPALENEELMA